MLVALEDAHILLELVDPAAHAQVRAGREEHLRRDAQVDDHAGVAEKGLYTHWETSIFWDMNNFLTVRLPYIKFRGVGQFENQGVTCNLLERLSAADKGRT